MITKALIVYYSLGGETKKAAEAVAVGLQEEGIDVTLKNAPDAHPEDLINCDFLVIGTPDYFRYLAGGMKDFFDRCWYPEKNRAVGKPYAAFVTCKGVGLAIKSVVNLSRRYEFRRLNRPMVVTAPLLKEELDRLRLFGKHIAQTARLFKAPSKSYHIHQRILRSWQADQKSAFLHVSVINNH